MDSNTGISSGAPGQIDIQRQLDALNVAERLRAVAVPSVNNNAAAAGNVANSSGSTLPTMSSSLGNFFIQANPNIGPLFQQDEHRGKGVLLRILAELHTRKGRPLPPGLTGMPVPMWNPAASTFRFELGAERGVVKIAGHDVDLFKLWQAIFHAGLLGKVTRDGLWPQITAQLGLPPTLPDGATPTSTQVQELGTVFIELENFLRQLMQSQRRPPVPTNATQTAPSSIDGSNNQPGLSALPVSGLTSSEPAQPASAGGGPSTPAQASDDSDSRKRKAEMDEDEETNRNKIRKVEEDASLATNTNAEGQSSPVKEEPQPEGPLLRRKIQYVPVMRTINTYGGRDLEAIERDYHTSQLQRPMRKMEDFGVVDVEALILQIRSRLKLEVTTALGLLYHLAYIRGGDRGNSGLQLSMCDELTDELLELLEETAFADSPDVDDPEDAKIDSKLVTNRDLVRMIQDEGNELFAGVKADQKFGDISPMHQPWEVVVMIITILSSVASADDNPHFLASRPRLLDIVTRVCMVRPIANRGEMPEPCSRVLQPRHLLRIRKDVTSLVATIAPFVRLDASPMRATRRLYLLLAATMMDSEECVSPGTPGRTPSSSIELALDAFTQISHPDINRKVIATEVPWEQLWSLMLMLARILPLTDVDIQHLVNGPWMAFVLRAAIAIYSLAVVAPLPMRHKMKASPSLRGTLIRFLCVGTTMNSPQNTMYRNLPIETRTTVEEYWKRIGETLKVIDAEEDPLAPTSSGAGGVIGYGIGGSYDQHLGAKPPARGTGMFGGSRQELLWSVMSTSAAGSDIQAFEEWDYMLRVDTSMASRV